MIKKDLIEQEATKPETDLIEQEATKPETDLIEQEATKPETDLIEQEAAKPETVFVELPLTRSETEPVYVALNGKSYLIKRGVKVEVPFGVAKILEHKAKMIQEAIAFESGFTFKE